MMIVIIRLNDNAHEVKQELAGLLQGISSRFQETVFLYYVASSRLSFDGVDIMGAKR